MANRFGIDLGEVYRTAEAVKGARNVNTLNKMKIDEAQYAIDQRPILEQQKKNLMSVRGEAASGSQEAMQKLFTLDPQIGNTLDAIYKMDEKQREQAKKRVEEMGQVAAVVLQQPTPEARAQTYAKLYQAMPKSVQQKLSPQYNEGQMTLALAKATPLATYLENPVKVEVGGEDRLYKAGREIDRAKTPVDPSKAQGSGSGSAGLKSGDESLMFKQTVEALGGIFDEQGNITALDPAIRPKIQGIAAEATRIYMAESGISRTEAVKRALKKFGEQVPDAPMPDPRDPQNIRNYLLSQ